MRRLDETGAESELEHRPGIEKAKVAYDGQAIGRTAEHVHFAVDTGVLAIPVDQIFEVQPLSRTDDNFVRIVVNDAHQVKYVKGGLPLGEDVTPDPSLLLALSNATMLRRVIVCFPTGIDTATITAGRPDATDDTIVVCCW